jgi:thiol-disulfide isomerase/thioredoxin
MKKKTFLQVLLVLTLAVVPLSAQNGTGTATPVMSEGQELLYALGFDIPRSEIKAPSFSLTTLTGDTASLEEASGKLLMLNLWATWCPPCRAEMPSMETIYQQLKSQGFEMYAVAAPSPPQETLEKIESYISENGYTFPVPIDKNFEVNAMYGTGSIPTTWLISPEGIIIARLTGAIDWASPEIVKALKTLLP